ncbi:hypothetical protein COCNU_12G005980 [Cocos nucifera]|uniref:Late embryogenesis abundant protein LEA-2 subgroup domain-containing protein n=1 Tax=Cocos nucifera TaxID=13894 RepID=A0A8K0NBC4_COCNU|nr:hypothetical protein COCNU_12G005980 [Cocos nucifera]
MTESGDSSPHLKDSSSSSLRRHRHRHRRRCLILGGACLLLLLVLGVVALVLYLTLFKPRDPTMKLVSARVEGVFPRLSLPAVRIELNVTLELEVLVHNPNRAAFDYAEGHTVLYYHGAQVGDADLEPGRVPPRGDGHVQVRFTVEADRFATKFLSLIADVAAGEVPFDSSTEIPGRVTILGFIKRHVVAESECHIGIGVPKLRVKSQECSYKTEL